MCKRRLPLLVHPASASQLEAIGVLVPSRHVKKGSAGSISVDPATSLGVVSGEIGHERDGEGIAGDQQPSVLEGEAAGELVDQVRARDLAASDRDDTAEDRDRAAELRDRGAEGRDADAADDRHDSADDRLKAADDRVDAADDRAEAHQNRVDSVEAERRALETLESMSDAFFTLDEEWQFTYLNPQTEAILERSRADLLGKNMWEEFPWAIGTRSDDEYRQVLSEQVPARFEEYYPPLGRVLEIRAHPVPTG